METSIFNFFNRHQVYLEGVKNWHASDLKRYLKLISDAVKDYLAKLGVKTLGELTKAKLSRLVKTVTDKVNKVMGQYGTEFLAELQRFTRIDTTMQRSVFSSLKDKVDFSGVKVSSVWSAAKDRIVPAFGSTVKDKAVSLAAVAKDRMRVRINRGHADNEETAAVAAALTGNEGSVLTSIANDVRGFVHTAFQHATAVTSEFLSSVFYDCYQWCSVLDSKTTEVCRDRNGNVYRWGEGPLPPAHNYCRSRTIPVECGQGPVPVPTFFNWLKSQSRAFLNDAFGTRLAASIVAGGDNAKNAVSNFLDYPPLSLDEFELKLELLKD